MIRYNKSKTSRLKRGVILGFTCAVATLLVLLVFKNNLAIGGGIAVFVIIALYLLDRTQIQIRAACKCYTFFSGSPHKIRTPYVRAIFP